MKKIIIYTFCIFCFSCKNESKTNVVSEELSATAKQLNDQIHKESFQKLIDSAGLKGSILLYDAHKAVFYSNDFEWANIGQLPASTYKIPNSIIGLETKEVDESTIFKWDGESRFMKSWEEDLTLEQAFTRSCVPCYQEVARKIGVKRMNEYLEKLQYGTIKVDTTNLENFWLRGNASITQFQQIDFLKRLQEETLPISKRTSRIVKSIMIIKETNNYVLRGKTGWSIEGDYHNGWFVGYVKNKEKLVYFATNVTPVSKEFNRKKFQENRKLLTYKALKEIGILL